LRKALLLTEGRVQKALAEAAKRRAVAATDKAQREEERAALEASVQAVVEDNKRLQKEVHASWASARRAQALARARRERYGDQVRELQETKRRLEQEGVRWRKELAAVRARLLGRRATQSAAVAAVSAAFAASPASPTRQGRENPTSPLPPCESWMAPGVGAAAAEPRGGAAPSPIVQVGAEEPFVDAGSPAPEASGATSIATCREVANVQPQRSASGILRWDPAAQVAESGEAAQTPPRPYPGVMAVEAAAAAALGLRADELNGLQEILGHGAAAGEPAADVVAESHVAELRAQVDGVLGEAEARMQRQLNDLVISLERIKALRRATGRLSPSASAPPSAGASVESSASAAMVAHVSQGDNSSVAGSGDAAGGAPPAEGARQSRCRTASLGSGASLASTVAMPLAAAQGAFCAPSPASFEGTEDEPEPHEPSDDARCEGMDAEKKSSAESGAAESKGYTLAGAVAE